MKAHTDNEFLTFMSQLRETNAPLGFYTDFKKCNANVGRIAMRLNQLNYLIGQPDFEAAIRELWQENPNAFSVLDILIAVRAKDKKITVDENGCSRLISSYFENVEGVITFFRETGLQEVFQLKQVKNLVDYVFGVEVGLDTNARKNRGGHIMETVVGNILKRNDICFSREVSSEEFPVVQAALGKDKKRFDFVVVTPARTYLMEVNFYSGGGSKLNEVARAYTELAPRVNACAGYEFVWITDGVGWQFARTKLAEAFYAIPSIYNLTTISDFVRRVKDDCSIL